METVAAIVSALVAAIGLFASWFKAREATLRRQDVSAWADEVITSMQELNLAFSPEKLLLDDHDRLHRVQVNLIRTSVLAERGRLFFKNTVSNSHGAKKKPAYRGYRPRILDNIIIIHEAAVCWQTANDHLKTCLRLVADDCQKNFVSLIQSEVGRSRTGASVTSMPGSGSGLTRHIQNLDPVRIRQAEHKRGL